MDIYGKVRNIVGERSFIPFRYQGQYEDEEIELYYKRFRYYSADSSTYISQDSIGLEGGMPNMYAYVAVVCKQFKNPQNSKIEKVKIKNYIFLCYEIVKKKYCE